MLLAKRHENKYYISRGDAQALMGKLNVLLKKDINDQDNGYWVTSLYYDDPYNCAYHDKLDGTAERFKFRIRYYNEDQAFFKLEKKSKHGTMTLKTSSTLTYEEVEKLMRADYSFLTLKEEGLYKEFYHACTSKLFTPKSLVRYRRNAYTHPIGDMRITFDDLIQSSTNNDLTLKGEWYPLMQSDMIIMEVKFNGVMPEYLKRLLESGNTTQASASKYVFARKYNIAF
jgi:hypothetical protein